MHNLSMRMKIIVTEKKINIITNLSIYSELLEEKVALDLNLGIKRTNTLYKLNFFYFLIKFFK